MSGMNLQPTRPFTNTGFARSGPRSLGNSTLEPARDRAIARGVERPRKRPNESEKRGVGVVRGLARSRSLRSLRSLGSSLAAAPNDLDASFLALARSFPWSLDSSRGRSVSFWLERRVPSLARPRARSPRVLAPMELFCHVHLSVDESYMVEI